MVNQYLVGLFVLLAVYSSAHALIYKKDSRAAFGWIAVCIFLPFMGPLLYFIFGINRVHKRAQVLSTPLTEDRVHGESHFIHDQLIKQIPDSLTKLEQVSSHTTDIHLSGGNFIEILYSGKQTYSEMLEAINNAEEKIYLCVYIFKKDVIGNIFTQALIEAQKRGVEVCVLIDGIGELYSWGKIRKKLLKNNIKALSFLPPKLLPFNFSINLRNHRKILVVDNKISFVGGMNISDEYFQNNKFDEPVLKDIHFKVTGSFVKQLSRVFEADWHFSGGKIDKIVDREDNNVASPTICRTIIDGPGENLDHLSIILISAVNSASNQIILMTPYFLPSRELISAMQIAALRGVSVTIILPGKNNLNYVHWASRHMLWELLEHGVEIFYQPPPFSHSKIFVVDSQYSLIGSANIDPRSLRLNYEIGVEIYEEEFAIKLSNYANEILQVCRRVTLNEVDGRPLLIKIRDGIAWLFSPYL